MIKRDQLAWVVGVVLVLGWGAMVRADLVWKTTDYKETAKPGQKQAKAEFAFTNAGKAPVTLVEVSTSCGCTMTKLAKKRCQVDLS